VDPFALIILSGVAVMVIAVYLVGRFYPGSGLDEIGMRTARQIIEDREALEADDLDQMLAAHNARRRAHGEREVTAHELELRVVEDMRDQQRRREEYVADQARRREKHAVDDEIEQLLEATNARRRARGEAPRTRDDVRREFEQ
jgi:hypothetical protein